MKKKTVNLVKVKKLLDRMEKLLKESPELAERTRNYLSGDLPGELKGEDYDTFEYEADRDEVTSHDARQSKRVVQTNGRR